MNWATEPDLHFFVGICAGRAAIRGLRRINRIFAARPEHGQVRRPNAPGSV
nr:MAG TPA: hypothetical protein [Caudoviricetes sp.]